MDATEQRGSVVIVPLIQPTYAWRLAFVLFLFFYSSMQMALPLGCADADVPWLRNRLRDQYGSLAPFVGLDPMSQFVKSFISSLTRDAVSEPAFQRLLERYPDWSGLAAADWHEVAAVIHDVTHAEAKAQRLGPALTAIAAERGEYSLDFLAAWPVERALRWLEQRHGVGRKIAASTLNFSSLRKAAFVVDQHVLKVVRRFGLIGPRADTVQAYRLVMEAVPDWDAFALVEFHALVKHLGQTVCRPVGRCRECILASHCAKVAAGHETKKAALPPPS